MRYFVLAVLFFIPLSVTAQNVEAQQTDTTPQSVLIHNIQMEGFVLQDKNQFVKLFKPYRNKYLTADDVDAILRQIQEIYEQAGYQGLVSIEHRISKKCLIFTIALIE